jgi:isocitrate/isopropylmalate dehydrogenase
VTLIPGDGIGAEVAESVKTVFKADNVPIEWEQIDVSGVETGDKHSEELFRESILSLKRNKLGLKGQRKHLLRHRWKRGRGGETGIGLSDHLAIRL